MASAAASTANPPPDEPKTATPASQATRQASGISSDDSWFRTTLGSSPESFVTTASKQCQSGKAKSACRPPSLNSSTVRRWRLPRSTSFRTRPSWKNPSPVTTPATGHISPPRTRPRRSTARFPLGRVKGGRGQRRTTTPAAAAIAARRPIASQIVECMIKTAAHATKSDANAQATMADVLRCPRARATSRPGRSTTTVAKARRRYSISATDFRASMNRDGASTHGSAASPSLAASPRRAPRYRPRRVVRDGGGDLGGRKRHRT